MRKWLSHWFTLLAAVICVVWEVWQGFHVWAMPVRMRRFFFLPHSLEALSFALAAYVIWILWLDGVKVLSDWTRKLKGLRTSTKTT